MGEIDRLIRWKMVMKARRKKEGVSLEFVYHFSVFLLCSCGLRCFFGFAYSHVST